MSKVRVLHFSTHNEDCGIGKYQEMFLEAMAGNEGVENKFFDVSPNRIRVMPPAERAGIFNQLGEELKDYDILHIQHEFSFYPDDEFVEAVKTGKNAGKKVIVTVHTSPTLAYTHENLGGYSPRSLVHYLRARKKEAFFTQRFAEPLKQADLVLVHNQTTRAALEGIGVSGDNITQITIPVPEAGTVKPSQEIAKHLNKKSGDIIYATTGFLHRYKGVDHAIKALAFLPKHYKLAVIGGMHQDHDHKIYNDLCDLIQEWGLIDRVYITGFIADDDKLNSLIQECDVCVYPYDKVYYSNVSSAALNLAFSNNLPVIGYPTSTFMETAQEAQALLLTQSFSYYELARSLQTADLPVLKKHSHDYAVQKSYPVIAKDLVAIYQQAI